MFEKRPGVGTVRGIEAVYVDASRAGVIGEVLGAGVGCAFNHERPAP